MDTEKLQEEQEERKKDAATQQGGSVIGQIMLRRFAIAGDEDGSDSDSSEWDSD